MKYWRYFGAVACACLLLVGVTGCGEKDIVTINNQQKVLISLYFPDKETHQLVEEKRFGAKERFSSTEDKITFVLEELRKGPVSDKLESPFPEEGTISLKEFTGHTAVVDFSQDFVDAHSGGSTGEFLTLYSITNSLTRIPEVERVSFTIDGQETDQFKGHFDLTETFSFGVDEQE